MPLESNQGRPSLPRAPAGGERRRNGDEAFAPGGGGGGGECALGFLSRIRFKLKSHTHTQKRCRFRGEMTDRNGIPKERHRREVQFESGGASGGHDNKTGLHATASGPNLAVATHLAR